jgi:hypothetical protein
MVQLMAQKNYGFFNIMVPEKRTSEKVLCHKDKLILTFNDLNSTKLKINEWVFLEECWKSIRPLTMSLDRLQNENNGYLGYIAPTILIGTKTFINPVIIRF